MRTMRFAITIAAVACFVALGSGDAWAQKKKAATPAPAPAAAAPVVQEKVTTPAPPAKSGLMMRDVLARFKGQLTTLGKLKQVEVDCFIVVDDGSEIIYPLSSIASLKVLKPAEKDEDEDEEEAEPVPTLEIKLH